MCTLHLTQYLIITHPSVIQIVNALTVHIISLIEWTSTNYSLVFLFMFCESVGDYDWNFLYDLGIPPGIANLFNLEVLNLFNNQIGVSVFKSDMKFS